MTQETTTRRGVLQGLGAAPLLALLGQARGATAQGTGGGPAKVDTKGLTAKIKFESVLSGYLGELNGKYKRRVTELEEQMDAMRQQFNELAERVDFAERMLAKSRSLESGSRSPGPSLPAPNS